MPKKPLTTLEGRGKLRPVVDNFSEGVALERIVRQRYAPVVESVLAIFTSGHGYRCRIKFVGEILGATFSGATRREVLARIELEVAEIAGYTED
jgi:hypothetical protein